MSLENIDLSTLTSGQFCWTQEYCPYKFNLPCDNLVGVYVADEISVTESISFTTSSGEHRVQNWSDRRGSACTDGFGTLAQTTSENAPFFKPSSRGGKGIRFDGKSWLTGQLKNIINDSKSEKEQFTLVFSGVESPSAGADKSTRPLFSFRADGGMDLEVYSQPFGADSSKGKAITTETLNFSSHAANSTASTYAVVIDNLKASFYKNGDLISTAAQGNLPAQAGILDLGCRLALNTATKTGNTIESHEDTRAMGDCFKGTLLGFAAYKKALSVEDIQRVGRALSNEEEIVIRPSCAELPAPLHGSIQLVANRQGEVNKEGSSVIFRCHGSSSNDTENTAVTYMWQSAFPQFATCDKFGRWSGYQSGVVPACVVKEELDVLEGRKVFADDDLLSWDALEELAKNIKDGFGDHITESGVIKIEFPADLEGRFWFEIEYYGTDGKFHPNGFLILSDGSTRFLTAAEAALFAKQKIQMENAANEQQHNSEVGTKNPDGSRTVVERNKDGSVTTTTYNKDGSITSETVYPDGSKSTSFTVTNPDGSTTTTIIGRDGKISSIHTVTEGNKTTTTINNDDGVTVIVVEKKDDGSIVTSTTKPDGTVKTETKYTNGTVETVTTKPDGSTWTVEVHPDTTTVVTVVAPNGSKTTTTTKPDGTKVTVTTDTDGNKTTTTVKPDGTVIVETKKPDGSKDVSTWNPDGSYNNTVTKPDGTTIVTVVKPDGSAEIITKNPDGSKETVVVTPGGDRTVTVVDKDGKTTTRTESGAPVKVPPVPGTDFTYEYKDKDGNQVVVIVDSDGKVITKITKPDGTVETIVENVLKPEEDSLCAHVAHLNTDCTVAETPVTQPTDGTPGSPSDCVGKCCGIAGLKPDCSTGIDEIDDYPRDANSNLPINVDGIPVVPVLPQVPYPEIITSPHAIAVEIPVIANRNYFTLPAASTSILKVLRAASVFKGTALEKVLPGNILYEFKGTAYVNGVYVDRTGSPYYLTGNEKTQMDSLKDTIQVLGALQLGEDAVATTYSIFRDVAVRLQTLNLSSKLAAYAPHQVVYSVNSVSYEPYGAVVTPSKEVIELTRREWQSFQNVQALSNAAVQTIVGFIDPTTARLPIHPDTGKVIYPTVNIEDIVEYISLITETATTTTTVAVIHVPETNACLGKGRGYGLDCDDTSSLIGFASDGKGGLIPVTENMFKTGLYKLVDLPDLSSNGCAAVRKLDTLGYSKDRTAVCNGKHTFRTAANEGLFKAALNIDSVAMLGLPSANYFTTIVTTACPDSCQVAKFEDKNNQERTEEERIAEEEREAALEFESAPWGTDKDGYVTGPTGERILIDGKPIKQDELKHLLLQQEENRLAQLEGAQDLIQNYLENMGSHVTLQEYYTYNGAHYQRGKAVNVNITPLMPKFYTVVKALVALRSGQLGQGYQVSLKKVSVPADSVLAVLNYNVDQTNFADYGYAAIDPAILSGDSKIVSLITAAEIPALQIEQVLSQNPTVVASSNSTTLWANALTHRPLEKSDVVKVYNQSVELLNVLAKLDAVEVLYKETLERELLSGEENISNNTNVNPGKDDWSYFEPTGPSEEAEEPFVPLPNEQCTVPPHNYIGPGYLTRANSHGLDKYAATETYSAVLICDATKEYYPIGVASESLSCSNSTWARPQTLRCAKACRKWNNTETAINRGLVASPVPQSALPGTSTQVRCGSGYVASAAIVKLRAGEQPSASSYEDVASCLTDRKWSTKHLECYGVGRLSISSGRGAVLHSAPDALLTPSKTGARATDPQTLTVSFANEVTSSRFYKFIRSGLSKDAYAALHTAPPAYPVTFYSSGQNVKIEVPSPVSFSKSKYLQAANQTAPVANNATLLDSVVSSISNLFGTSFLQTGSNVPAAAATAAVVVEEASANQVISASLIDQLTPAARLNNGTYLDFLQPREFNVTQYSREARSFETVSNVFDVGCSVSIASALALSDKTAHTADMHQSPFATLTDCFRGYVSQVAIWRRQLSAADVASWNEVSRRFMTLAHSKDISQEFVLEQVAEAKLTSALAGLFIANDAFMDFDASQLRVSSGGSAAASATAATRAVTRWRNVIPRPDMDPTDASVSVELREAYEHYIEALVQSRVQSQPVYADGVGIFFDGKDDFLVSSTGFRPYSHVNGFTINIQATTTRAFGVPQVLVSFPSPNTAAAALAATNKEYQCTSLGPDLKIGLDLAERESETLSVCSWRQKGYLTTASTLKPTVAQMVVATAQEELRVANKTSTDAVTAFVQLSKASKKTTKSNNLSTKTASSKPAATVAASAAKSNNVVTTPKKSKKSEKTAKAEKTVLLEQQAVEAPIDAPVEGLLPEVTGDQMPQRLGVPVDPSLPLEKRPGYMAARAYLNSLSVNARTQYKKEIDQVEEVYRSLPDGVDADLEDLVAYMRFEGMDRAPDAPTPQEVNEQNKLQAKLDARMKADQEAVQKRLDERATILAHAEQIREAREAAEAARVNAASSFVEGAQPTNFVESGYASLIRSHEAYRLKQNGAKSNLGKLFNPASRVAQDRASLMGVDINTPRQPKQEKKTATQQEASE